MSKSPWHVRLSREAERNLDDFDPQVARRILKYLDERVATMDNPRKLGKALKGSEWGDCWRYRCGDYRIIVDIIDREIVVHVLRIGNRKNVY